MVGKSQWQEWLVTSAVRKERRAMVVEAQLTVFSFVFNSGPNPAEMPSTFQVGLSVSIDLSR